MIAELYGKISSTGSNLNDRLEDNLTGDIFGALRYLPFHLGIAPILKKSRVQRLPELLENSSLEFWADRITFWPYHEQGELDVLIELENAVIGIEVKYFSGLSSDDEVDNSASEQEAAHKTSVNQLTRESRIVGELAGSTKEAFLIFVANDSACAAVYHDVISRNILAEGVSLGYLSWQEILTQLKKAVPSDRFQAVVLSDLAALLIKKKFERFESFQLDSDCPVSADGWFCYCDLFRQEWTFCYAEIINGGGFYEYR